MPLIGICLTSLLIVVLGNPLFRNTTADLQPHPDEIIPMRVIQTMDAHGDLNSDWGRADLPAYFQVCRYNFSGYIVASYVAIKLLAPETLGSDQALRAALQRLSAISAILSLCVVLLLLTRQLGLGYGIAGAIGTAILPQFFQSAHYARPEAMATLGFTLCFALATLRPAATSRRLATVVAIGVLAGFLTSIKITYGVSLAFALPLLFALSWERDRHVVRLAMAACCVITLGGAFLAGFAMGAPHVLVDFQGYLDGVRALQQQYSGIHPPHSPASAGPLAQGELLARYYVATVGLPFIALFVMGHVARDMRGAKAAFAIITLVLMALFLCQTVFFERNFSPLMPSFVIVATSGLAWLVGKLPSSAPGSRNSAPVELVIASLVWAICLWTPYSIFSTLREDVFARSGLLAQQAKLEASTVQVKTTSGARNIVTVGYADVFAGNYPAADPCNLYVVVSYNDPWSDEYIESHPQHLHVAAVTRSLFEQVPTSTLHTYHSASHYMLTSPGYCTG